MTDTSAERAEAERDENEKAIAVWRGRTQRAEAERDRLRAAILDTAPHDAGLVPMRLRLMAKGETGHD
jgi:hypothetical protein